ncbi:MAG: ABC transporter permease [Alphaproteobacteria bacterium]
MNAAPAGRLDKPCLAAAALGLAGLVLPWLGSGPEVVGWSHSAFALGLAIATVVIAAYCGLRARADAPRGLLLTFGTALGSVAVLQLARAGAAHGVSLAAGVWIALLALVVMAWRAMELLAAPGHRDRLASLAVPALFGLWLAYLWEVLVVGFGVPQILLPSPSEIGAAFAASTAMLWADFQQTFLKAVLAGFVVGCGSGFVVALLVDRVPFLERGLLPLGSLVSAIPIVGIAPIMVMWFGFDWQSKAAVVVVMTFFPMLVNTNAGLAAAGRMERDLMHSYAAGYFQTLLRLRLPTALPFIFNALKINSTLALIGAIVAEFFGTPIVGMGFRISVEAGRMNIPTVWATIAVAALAGSLFYGILQLLERALTFWHPSYRR